MGVTKVDELNTAQTRLFLAGDLPTAPYLYYGSASNDVDSTAWKGGELAYNTRDTRLYVQTATSGATAVWKRYADQIT